MVNRCSWTDARDDDYDLREMRWQSAHDCPENSRQGEAFRASLHAASRCRITDSCLPVAICQRPLRRFPFANMSIIRQSVASPAPVAPASSQPFDNAQPPFRPQAGLPGAREQAAAPQFYSVKPHVEPNSECPPPPSNEPRITYLRRPSSSRRTPPSAATVPDKPVAAPEPVPPAAAPAVSHENARAEARDSEPVDARHAGPNEHSLSKATADQRNCPTSANGAGKPEEARQPIVHQFSRSFARQHGIKAALLARYLAHRIAATHKREGEGYRCSLDELTSHYPYLRRSAVAAALQQLVKTRFLTVHHHNRRACDHTSHYAFASADLQRAAQVDPIYFSVDDAVQHNLPAALLLTNLRMRITDERSRQRLGATYRVCARELTKHLPLTRSTISRTLQQLDDARIVKLSRRPGFDRALEVEVASVLPAGAEPDSCDAEPDVHGANPDVHAPIPDITRTLQVDIESDHSKSLLESINSYKGRPAPPSAACACFLSLPPDTQPMPASDAAGETAGPESMTSNPGSVPAVEQNGASVSEETCLPSPLPSNPDLLPATLVTESPTAPFQFKIDPNHPFELLPQATPPPRQPFPDTLEKLQLSNMRLFDVDSTPDDQRFIVERVMAKMHAVIEAQGVGRVFRWLAIKDSNELFRIIREAVGRCHCRNTDLCQVGSRQGVDEFCVDWWVQACPRYLDANRHEIGHRTVEIACGVLSAHLPSYYRSHLEELEREGLAYLRYGGDVQAETLHSPDVEREQVDHLSAAEKARVFENALLAINRVGHRTERGRDLHQVVVITNAGLKLARRFFELNPHWTAGHLLGVLDECIMQERHTQHTGGFREDFAVIRGTHLTYFMRYFDRIITQLEYHPHIPDFHPVESELKEAA